MCMSIAVAINDPKKKGRGYKILYRPFDGPRNSALESYHRAGVWWHKNQWNFASMSRCGSLIYKFTELQKWPGSAGFHVYTRKREAISALRGVGNPVGVLVRVEWEGLLCRGQQPVYTRQGRAVDYTTVTVKKCRYVEILREVT